ncbi:Thiamine pyrophosphokinase [Phaffia rhodozyma]|uniref:Thiamine pyrophosphokinase n=1 Tax=Phaffia rhodozyma TaxID=264483 RepID=A0A0F7SM55_PHARH|nr:Thiamine pyrophosphokinase [Phaffia rhodozyma]
MPSLLPIVQTCDNTDLPISFDPATNRPPVQTPFYLTSTSTKPIGHLLTSVVDKLIEYLPNNTNQTSLVWERSKDGEDLGKVYFGSECVGFERRSRALKELVERWKADGQFKNPLDGWRNELYTIYGPLEECDSTKELSDSTPGTFGKNAAFALERAACGLFGVVTFGIHINGYVVGDDGQISLWIPRRAATKQTYPLMLDQTVAGGLTHGLDPLVCAVKECQEEASIPESLVLEKGRLKPEGEVKYLIRTDDGTGWIQPEFQYIFDLKLPSPDVFTPTPCDGEVESFELMAVPRIIELLHRREFKPNCALVMIDFLIRFELLTAESEENFEYIKSRLRRDFGLPGIVLRDDA